MIPRHQPAYSWSQWLGAFRHGRSADDLATDLSGKICKLLGRKHALFYNRGRDAIHAYFASITPGQPVILPAFTCCVVPEAIRNAGCPIHYVDISERSLNLEPENLADFAPPAGSVLVMTHQWGIPCRADELTRWAQSHGIATFEDCASALGAQCGGRPCGSFGEVSIISFETTKLLGSGRLGVLLTDNDRIAESLRADQRRFLPADAGAIKQTALLKIINSPAIYRQAFALWSRRQGDVYSDHGEQKTLAATYYRQRPHPFQFALVLAQWDDLERRIEHRRRLMAIYREALGDAQTCTPNPDTAVSPIRQPIRAADKRAFYEAMFRRGIDLGWSFNYTVAPRVEGGRYPSSTRVAQSILNLPIHEGVSLSMGRSVAKIASDTLKLFPREPS